MDMIPLGVDASQPSSARIYDCFLGGTDNFAPDREVAARTVQIMPDFHRAALANRAFLGRVVRYLVTQAGIRQFLDIGSGLPIRGNVHQIARQVDRQARVVYVDSDPMIVAHTRALLAGDFGFSLVTADLRRPEEILAHPTVRQLIDFSQPVGLLMFAIIHHIHDEEDPVGLTARLRDALPPGSFVGISHFHNPGQARPADAKHAIAIEKLFNAKLGTGRWRTRAEILAYFGDFELIEPGLVPLPEWRPDPGSSRQHTLTHHLLVGGVAQKS